MEVQIIPEFWTLIFTWFNAVVLFLILRHFLFVPVKQFMENRKASIQSEFDLAEKTKQEAFALKNQYDNKILGIVEEKKRIIEEARGSGAQIYENAKAEAEKEKARILDNAEKLKTSMFDKARQELRQEAAQLSVNIAQEILKKEINPDTNKVLIRDIINDIKDVKV